MCDVRAGMNTTLPMVRIAFMVLICASPFCRVKFLDEANRSRTRRCI